MLFLSHVTRIILQFNGTFYLELVPYDFPLVVLHTISVVRNAKLQEVEYVCHINNDMCTREKPSYEGERHLLV
jgi:hypothetical protein